MSPGRTHRATRWRVIPLGKAGHSVVVARSSRSKACCEQYPISTTGPLEVVVEVAFQAADILEVEVGVAVACHHLVANRAREVVFTLGCRRRGRAANCSCGRCAADAGRLPCAGGVLARGGAHLARTCALAGA